ncbi:hypothetical protein ACOTF2_18440 [Achromobacter xylosoxidans]
MQERTQVQTTPPLSGVELVSQINSLAQTLGTNLAGDTDPAAMAWPFATWADTANMVLKRRNAANTAWVLVSKLLAYAPDASETAYRSKMVGEVFYVWDHLMGVTAPVNTLDGVRFIKLTASDSYNTGMLSGETVTGSAPLVVATAVISYPDSPINGATVSLINTERRVLRAGSSGVVQNDALQNLTGRFGVRRPDSSGATVIQMTIPGAFNASTDGGPAGPRIAAPVGSDIENSFVDFDASRVARTATETRTKNIGITAYMRIQ